MADPLEEFFGGGAPGAPPPQAPTASASPEGSQPLTSDVEKDASGRLIVRPSIPRTVDENVQQVGGVMASAGLGVAKAGIEAKDFFTGGAPDFADRSQVRKWVEERSADLNKE